MPQKYYPVLSLSSSLCVLSQLPQDPHLSLWSIHFTPTITSHTLVNYLLATPSDTTKVLTGLCTLGLIPVNTFVDFWILLVHLDLYQYIQHFL